MLTMQDIICWNRAEDMPKKSGDYLVITQYGNLMVLSFSVRYSGWNLDDDFDDRDCEMQIQFWAELPELAHQISY